MLQIQHIKKEYRTGSLVQKALDDVSLNLRDNEFVAILGPSGSGKTTLLNIIGGLDRYDSGDLIINGISTKKYKDRDWDSYRNHTIGFVFQSYNLLPHLTAAENIILSMDINHLKEKNKKQKAIELLNQVGLSSDYAERKILRLSGGEQQRVAIARSLSYHPNMIIADEPTGNLDRETEDEILTILKDLAHKEQKCVIIVTHSKNVCDNVDVVYELKKQKV